MSTAVSNVLTSLDLEQRLRGIPQPAAALDNGTSLAAVLGSALEVDLRRHGGADGLRRLLALKDDTLLALASELAQALQDGGHKFDLPLGSRVRSSLSGEVRIDNEPWALDADRPGLQPEQTISASAGGANLAALHREMTQLLRRLSWRTIGLPVPQTIVDGGVRHFLRFPPFAPAGGVVLLYPVLADDWTHFRSACAREIAALAHKIVRDMHLLWIRRNEIAAFIAEARPAIDEAVLQTGLPFRAVTIIAPKLGPLDLVVEFDGTDDTLRHGVVTAEVAARGGSPTLTRWPSLAMQEEAERLKALGANGMIDDIARAAVLAAPEGSAALLARLANEVETTITFPLGDDLLHVFLFWNQGILRGELEVSGRILQVGRKIEIIDAQLPETVLAGLGRPRLDQVLELPFPCGAEVVAVENSGDGVELRYENGSWLVNTATGEIWPEPS